MGKKNNYVSYEGKSNTNNFYPWSHWILQTYIVKIESFGHLSQPISKGYNLITVDLIPHVLADRSYQNLCEQSVVLLSF